MIDLFWLCYKFYVLAEDNELGAKLLRPDETDG